MHHKLYRRHLLPSIKLYYSNNNRQNLFIPKFFRELVTLTNTSVRDIPRRHKYLRYSSSDSITRITMGSQGNQEMLGSIRGSGLLMESLEEKTLADLVNNLDAVVFDCDGVLWIGMDPIKGAKDLVIKLRSLGKKVFFLTNNSTKTQEEFLAKFTKLGFQSTPEEIVGTSHLAALYLKEQNYKGKAYVIGTSGITGELKKVGITCLPIGPDPMPADMCTWNSSQLDKPVLDPEVKAVVVGFDHHLSYAKICKAASYLQDPNCHFIATNTDERFPSASGIVLPGTGAIVNAVKTAAEREPKVMGKPHTYAFEYIQRSHKLDPSRVLMIGDRANTDIFFGKNCGLWTLLVLSGVTSVAEVENWKKSDDEQQRENLVPDFILPDVSKFLDLIEKCKA